MNFYAEDERIAARSLSLLRNVAATGPPHPLTEALTDKDNGLLECGDLNAALFVSAAARRFSSSEAINERALGFFVNIMRERVT